MFGRNKERALEMRPDGFLQVHEVFSTIQGEGPWSGYPAIFIRLTGCNLRCFFCDTKWDDENNPYLSPVEILAQVQAEYRRTATKGSVTPRVVLTGGEPARQNCAALVDLLISEGYLVQIETAGTYWADWLMKTTIVVSPKTKHVHPQFYRLPPGVVHWKYVIRAGEVSKTDGLPSQFTQQERPTQATPETFILLDNKYGVPARPPAGADVWLSPCNEYNEKQNRANYQEVAQQSMNFGYRAQVQLHVILQLP